MKNEHKFFPIGIIALTAIIGLVLAACGGGPGGHICAPGAAATCITSQTCMDCGDIVTPALHHNVVAGTQISEGVHEGTCSRCGDTHAHIFTYNIGDTGPAGGIIFYVADGEDGRPDGITIQGYTGASGSFAAYTAYYLEAAPANETASDIRWGAASGNTSIAGITTWANATAKDAGLTASIGVGRKDTQTIVNSTAFAALTDTAAQRCANKTLNGFTDWFLPSLGELYEMYKAGVAGVTGIPTTGWFWSSSQHNTNSDAWLQSFVNGGQNHNLKSNSNLVRAIRAF